MSWFVYLVRGSRGDLYCGSSTDPIRRTREHNTSPRGSRWARGQRPVLLVWSQQVKDKSQALRLEAKIKRLSKAQKDIVVEFGSVLEWDLERE